jgi:hypothetical protein
MGYNIRPMGIKITSAVMTVFLMTPLITQARPVSYPNGWMVMTMNDSTSNSTVISYSPTARDAFGIETDYIRNDESWLHTLTYNRLLQRWNNPGSQANIFLMTGTGFGEDHGEAAPAGFGGIETDWESRRYYISYQNRLIASSVNDQPFDQKARVGIAPYLADYSGTQAWLMLEFENNPSFDNKFIVTPLIRLFNTGFLTEVGYSSNKTLLLNATVQF